jgi:hypothetical protein
MDSVQVNQTISVELIEQKTSITTLSTKELVERCNANKVFHSKYLETQNYPELFFFKRRGVAVGGEVLQLIYIYRLDFHSGILQEVRTNTH